MQQSQQKEAPDDGEIRLIHRSSSSSGDAHFLWLRATATTKWLWQYVGCWNDEYVPYTSTTYMYTYGHVARHALGNAMTLGWLAGWQGEAPMGPVLGRRPSHPPLNTPLSAS